MYTVTADKEDLIWVNSSYKNNKTIWNLTEPIAGFYRLSRILTRGSQELMRRQTQ